MAGRYSRDNVREAPEGYPQSRAAQRQLWGARRIDGSAPMADPSRNKGAITSTLDSPRTAATEWKNKFPSSPWANSALAKPLEASAPMASTPSLTGLWANQGQPFNPSMLLRPNAPTPETNIMGGVENSGPTPKPAFSWNASMPMPPPVTPIMPTFPGVSSSPAIRPMTTSAPGFSVAPSVKAMMRQQPARKLPITNPRLGEMYEEGAKKGHWNNLIRSFADSFKTPRGY